MFGHELMGGGSNAGPPANTIIQNNITINMNGVHMVPNEDPSSLAMMAAEELIENYTSTGGAGSLLGGTIQGNPLAKLTHSNSMPQ
jgi:hypothetical protein